MSRPERVLLLRSGRHLHVAIDAVERKWPGAEIGVVGTPGSEALIERAGVPHDRIFIFAERPRFTPAAFICSRAAVAARRWRYDRVVVLWNDPDGIGQGNVDRTAFALAPRGFLAVTPDGGAVARRVWPQVRHELYRAAASTTTAVLLAALYVPALLLPARRR
jgi:hypothetical protein